MKRVWIVAGVFLGGCGGVAPADRVETVQGDVNSLDASTDLGTDETSAPGSQAEVDGPGDVSEEDSGARSDAAEITRDEVIPGTGFEETPIRFRVPDSGLEDGFFASGYVLGPRGWTTVDIDGDGFPDLLHTADTNASEGRVWRDGAGPFWKVYRGGQEGFRMTAERWSLPESGLADGFFSAFYGYDTRFWYLVDLDGDRRPELIQSADTARSGGFVWRDAAGPHWKVWRGELGGFSGAVVRWSVPDSGAEDGFYTPYAGVDTRQWTLLDVDSDGRLDLVQTADPMRSGGMVWRDEGGHFWMVWRGTSNGFEASGRRFSVPDSGLADGFFAARYQSPAPGERFWSLLDLDADGRSDLVQTADPTRTGGQVWRDERGPFWKAHFGRDGGFADMGEIRLGDSGLSDGFFASSYVSAPSLGGERFWLSIDLDGDGRIELVQTADPEQPGGFVFVDEKGSYWKVWPLDGGVDSPSMVRWSVPSSGLLDGFFVAYWTDAAPGVRAWFLSDLDRDGRLDLIQTADPSIAGLHVFKDGQGAFWQVFRGR